MAINKEKTDPELGRKVEQYLVEKGVNTPTKGYVLNNRTSAIYNITNSMIDILSELGLDLKDDSLKDTPKRVAKMFVDEIFCGLKPDNFPKIMTIENKMDYDEMIVVRDISLYSDCEHHLRPIVGKAAVAYIPNKKVIGLSKIPRIVEYFSRRPQVQERLTAQIFYALEYILETPNIAIHIEGTHLCVAQRGVEDTTSKTITNKFGGVFKDSPQTRAELLASIKGVN